MASLESSIEIWSTPSSFAQSPAAGPRLASPTCEPDVPVGSRPAALKETQSTSPAGFAKNQASALIARPLDLSQPDLRGEPPVLRSSTAEGGDVRVLIGTLFI